MAKTKSRISRSPTKSGKKSPMRQAAVSAATAAYLRAGAEQLSKASQSLRIAAAFFDEDGKPTAPASDLYFVAKEALDYLDVATWKFMEVTGARTPEERLAAAVNEGLYDIIDVLTLVCFALKNGKYPPSNGVTTSPAGGGLSLARRALLGPQAEVIGFLDQMQVRSDDRKMATVTAAQEARS